MDPALRSRLEGLLALDPGAQLPLRPRGAYLENPPPPPADLTLLVCKDCFPASGLLTFKTQACKHFLN